MKIVVFGGSGFLGSHVADYLSGHNHKVIIYDKKTSPYIKASQEMVVGDILDQEAVKKITRGADVIYNFAGIADISQAKSDPQKTIYTNVMGTTNLLESCRYNNVKRFIFASSVYVYSDSGSFYKTSKQAAELIIENYSKDYNIDFTILRYGSLYGPRADDSNWMQAMLKQVLLEKKIIRKGDGDEIREYIHVYDAARLSVEVLGDEFRNQHVMITGHQPIRMRDLLVMIKEMLNNEIELEFTRQEFDEHYEITPYNFRPKLAKRLVDSSYVDLGQGILELLHNINDENQRRGHALSLEKRLKQSPVK